MDGSKNVEKLYTKLWKQQQEQKHNEEGAAKG